MAPHACPCSTKSTMAGIKVAAATALTIQAKATQSVLRKKQQKQPATTSHLSDGHRLLAITSYLRRRKTWGRGLVERRPQVMRRACCRDFSRPTVALSAHARVVERKHFCFSPRRSFCAI